MLLTLFSMRIIRYRSDTSLCLQRVAHDPRDMAKEKQVQSRQVIAAYRPQEGLPGYPVVFLDCYESEPIPNETSPKTKANARLPRAVARGSRRQASR